MSAHNPDTNARSIYSWFPLTLRRGFRFVVKKILPRELQHEILGDLEEAYPKLWDFIVACIVSVWEAYRLQTTSTADKLLWSAQLALVLFCFAHGEAPLALMILTVVTLVTLILRDAFTHRPPASEAVPTLPSTAADAVEAVVDPDEGAPRTSLQYYMDSAADTAILAVTVLASQAVTLNLDAPLAMPGSVLFRGAMVFIPVLETIRMVLRPNPYSKEPFKGSKLSALAIYNRVRLLNFIWMVPCYFALEHNHRLVPRIFPLYHPLSNLVPLLTFTLWVRLQQDIDVRDKVVITTLDIDQDKAKVKETPKKAEYLFKGLDKSHPYYPAYVVLEVLFFIQLLFPVSYQLWQWLHSAPGHMDSWSLLFEGVLSMALILSWRFVKRSNQEAARALWDSVKKPAADPVT